MVLTIQQAQKQGLSFSSARELRQRIDLLPDTVPWKSIEVKVTGGKTAQPLILYYRPAIECLEFKLGDPRYKDHLDFILR